MSRFAYTALDNRNAEVQGVESADTETAARAALMSRGLQPIAVREKKPFWQWEISRRKVPRKELMHFSRQLAVFVRAGIPILEGLETISEETSNKTLRAALDEIGTALRSGSRFADAAAAHPHAFPPFYVSVLRSAELTGHLDMVLDQLADYIDRDIDARSKVMSALFYPAIVAVMAVATVLVLTVFVLPRFEVFFASLDAELPLPTRILLSSSHFVGQWWWLMAGSLVAGIVGLLAARRTKRGRAAY